MSLQNRFNTFYRSLSTQNLEQLELIYADQVTYILDGSLRQDTGIFENVSSGKHTVTVEHKEYGCGDDPVEVNVESYKPISFEVIETNINEYTVVASGGNPDYEYRLDSNDKSS